MWPWAHAAVGYLLYTLFVRVRSRRRPAGPAVLVLALGTQLPDLVDKPLAWYVPVLPTGRSLAHSLLVGGLVVALVFAYARRTDRTHLGTAFAVGYLSHPLADGLHPFVQGEWHFLAYLAWPVLPSPEYEGPESVLTRLAQLEPTPSFLFGLALTAVAALLWARHGYPGLETIRKQARRVPTGH